jgi:hypothetical protein
MREKDEKNAGMTVVDVDPVGQLPSSASKRDPSGVIILGASAPAEGKTERARLSGVEQIREILFGSIQRELERRLALVETHLAARANELQQESRRRTELLEAHLSKEIDVLGARVGQDAADASDAMRRTTRDCQQAIDTLEQRIAKVEGSVTQAERELRHALLEQSKLFLDELQRLRAELLATLQQELGLAEGELGEELGEAEQRRAS